jgi:hypothetical protein
MSDMGAVMQFATRTLLAVAVGLAGVAFSGCTHRQLTRNTVLTASTVMEIQYRIVLANLAMLSVHPEALPSHIEIDDGVIQISDGVGVGDAGGFTSYPSFGIERFGPSGSRQVSEQWGADATLDPQRLTDLQDLYRVALNLDPLPPSNSITFLRQLQDGERAANGSEKSDTDEAGEKVPDSGSRQVPIDILLSDVPAPGWYHLGNKRDVPRDACYVSCFGHRYIWVTSEGIPDLSRFTLAVLNVVKLKPGEPRRRGLAITR